MARVVVQFSCGATSAVAGKLALAQFAGREVIIVNAFIKEEHEDNQRFLTDCERWYGQKILQLRDTKYGASTDEVWRRRRFMKGPRGAPCSLELKRKLLAQFSAPGDTIVLGFDAGEFDRFEDFKDRYPEVQVVAPLIERGLSKADCLALLERAGIELPLLYRQGFNNANCVGCPKGGEGYWNRVRVVYPERFAQVMAIQEEIGEGAYFFRVRKTGERFGLKDLDPSAGRHDEPEISCSFFCESAEGEMDNPA